MSQLPHPSRLAPSHPLFAAIVAAHEAAQREGRRTYIDPATGLVVQTCHAHLDRGSCCSSGCRHCPWVDEN